LHLCFTRFTSPKPAVIIAYSFAIGVAIDARAFEARPDVAFRVLAFLAGWLKRISGTRIRVTGALFFLIANAGGVPTSCNV
jgi:hypothetical protein